MWQAAVVPPPVALALGGCVDSTGPDLSLDVGPTVLAVGAVLIDSQLRVRSRDGRTLYQAVGLVGLVRADVPADLDTDRDRVPVHLSLMAMSRDGKSLVLANGWNSRSWVGARTVP
jgi:hypothetical protein